MTRKHHFLVVINIIIFIIVIILLLLPLCVERTIVPANWLMFLAVANLRVVALCGVATSLELVHAVVKFSAQYMVPLQVTTRSCENANC